MFYDHGGGQLYLLAGYTGTNESIAGSTRRLDGFEWGGGINMKLAGNLYAKLEYNQVRYGDLSQFSSSVPVSWSQVDDRVLIGFGYSLGNLGR